MGCAITSRELYGGLFTFIVCQYLPTGNVDGFFLSNVMQLRFGGKMNTGKNRKNHRDFLDEFTVKSCNLSIIHGEISAFHRKLLKDCSFFCREFT